MKIIHPRPNPIVAAMYTLRDLDVDVIVVHGPAGCCFMASRSIEEAGVRVVTSGITDNDLVFGAVDSLIETLKLVKEKFDPKTVAVIGTCASMIIGEDLDAAIRRANIGCTVFPVDCHGCMKDNTSGAVKAIEAAEATGIISHDEASRQSAMMRAATELEKNNGMAGKDYLSPTRGPTKMGVAKMIIDTMKKGGTVTAAVIAKKELIYRFADIYVVLNEVQKAVGGKTRFFGNIDREIGLPRIRRYADDVIKELESKGIKVDTVGGLDEYAVIGQRMKDRVEAEPTDLLIVVGIAHSYPDIPKDAVLITDQ
ncbi:MAG: Ni-sirohydrochlorin a,c-diamide reductive cyclase catalytic subunit, partial [Candidatus Methanomethylophilaceae archaeon]|nr:Ni-sirohydrochlorin a,c-diamide reductive cyclase catalytic subunit [Candidatus Methanomethylophilaceae archaeon]